MTRIQTEHVRQKEVRERGKKNKKKQRESQGGGCRKSQEMTRKDEMRMKVLVESMRFAGGGCGGCGDGSDLRPDLFDSAWYRQL